MKTKLLTVLFSVAAASCACAHAFLDHADPAVGGSVQKTPTEVKLAFTEEVDPAASSLKVFDAAGKEVDGKNVHTDPKDEHLLIVSLSAPLAAGTYKVVWKAVSKDSHVTQGDFTFTQAP